MVQSVVYNAEWGIQRHVIVVYTMVQGMEHIKFIGHSPHCLPLDERKEER